MLFFRHSSGRRYDRSVILFELTEREGDQKELGGQIEDVQESACGLKKNFV